MVKLTKRKGFNFFRSYYDVYNELETDKDKVNFINALLDRQFLGIKPTDLKGMAKFAYISQTNSIDSQVKGYEDKTGLTLSTPTVGGTQGVKNKNLTPTQQVQVQVKEEVQDVKQSKIDYDSLLNLINSKTGRSFRIVNNSIKQKYTARLKEGYTKEDILNAIKNSVLNEFHINNNFSYLTPEFFSRSSTLDKYSTKSNIKPTLQVSHSTPVN